MKPQPMNNPTGRVLVVDDEANIRSGLQTILTRDGHAVHTAERAEDALAVLELFACEVAIIDIRLPDMSGIELLKLIHQRLPTVVGLILTGHGTLDTAITALREGAHDYLLKPVQPAAIRQAVTQALVNARKQHEQSDLLFWLRSRLQRLDTLAAPEIVDETAVSGEFCIGDLCIDRTNHEVRRDNTVIALTPSELTLLVMLAQNVGEAINYNTLAKHALGYEADLWEAKELVKRHIFTLRQKIEPQPDEPQYIHNVRGVGYRFALTGV